MAEYDMNDIVMQANRMCEQYNKCDDGCPLQKFDREVCCALCDDEILKAIVKVVQWAKENPEPKYPSWHDWQRETFPSQTRYICPMTFGVDCPAGAVTSTQKCTECRNQHIPADIAEKLGIKPIGGSENAD